MSAQEAIARKEQRCGHHRRRTRLSRLKLDTGLVAVQETSPRLDLQRAADLSVHRRPGARFLCNRRPGIYRIAPIVYSAAAACTCSTARASARGCPAVVGKRNAVTLRMEWKIDESKKIPVRFFTPGYSLQDPRFDSDRHSLDRPGVGQCEGPLELARHRSVGARPMVPLDVRHPHVAHHRHDRGVVEHGAGRAAGRHFRLFWRRGGYDHPTPDRIAAIAAHHSDLAGVDGRAAARLAARAGLLRDYDHPVADRLDDAGARSARPFPGAARRRLCAGGRVWPAAAVCASSRGTWCRRS